MYKYLIPNCYGNNIALSSYHSKFLWDDDSCVVACISLNSLLPVPPTSNPVPEIIDPVFTKTSQNARFLLSENERFGLVFVKTGSISSGTDNCSFRKYLWMSEYIKEKTDHDRYGNIIVRTV
jgi:hypothetical protein